MPWWMLMQYGARRAPEGDDNPGGGGAAKAFSQDEVNAIVTKEVKKAQAKFADYDAIKAKAAQVDDLTTRMAALEEEKALAGKSAEEKERARAAKESKKLLDDLAAAAKERDDMKAALESERGLHRSTRLRTKLGSALTASDVFPQAASDALDALHRESEAEFDDKGDLVSLTLNHDGTRYTASDLNKAAESFLKAKPWYAKGAPGGAGIKRPNGAGGAGGDNRPLHELSNDELLARAPQVPSQLPR